ncbi:protein DpdE [Alphaproteobacteria bacterium]|nr:protein DpdE [Alphaproteobacteria bacterium]
MKPGDLVRCISGPEKFLGIGCIEVIEEQNATLSFFHLPGEPLQFLEQDIENIKKVFLYKGTQVFYKTEETSLWYAGKVNSVDEDEEEVEVIFDRGLLEPKFYPVNQLKIRSSQSIERPSVFLGQKIYGSRYLADRRIEFLKSYSNFQQKCGLLGGLQSSSVELEEHQYNIVKRVNMDPIQRYLLADEVGLGKTIEACAVIRQYVLDQPETHSVLIIVPPQLEIQWRQELIQKFKLSRQLDETIFVVSFDSPGLIQRILLNVGMVVLDEAHNVNSASNSELFSLLRDEGAHLKRFLLLSATPLLDNEVFFYELLQLLDPSLYQPDQSERFKTQVANRQRLNEIVVNLNPDGYMMIDTYIDELQALFPEDGQLKVFCDYLSKLSLTIFDESDVTVVSALSDLKQYVLDAYKLDHRILRNRRVNVRGITVERTGCRYIDFEDTKSELFFAELENLRSRFFAQFGGEEEDRKTISWISEIIKGFLLRIPMEEIKSKYLDEVPKKLSRILPEDCQNLQIAFKSIEKNRNVEMMVLLVKEILSTSHEKIIIFCSNNESAEQLKDHLQAHLNEFEVYKYLPENTDESNNFNRKGNKSIIICSGEFEEGLNLHGVNRTVVNYDLPINPNRIEQRLGRVDRFGSSEFRIINIRDNSNPFEVELHSLLHNDIKIFHRSIASLQFIIERKFVELENKIGLDGAVALNQLSDEMRGEGGLIESELTKISRQDLMDSIQDDDDNGFQEMLEIDGNWEEFRKKMLAWSLDVLSLRTVPIVPYLLVKKDCMSNMESSFLETFSGKTLKWTATGDFTQFETHVRTITTEHDIALKFVPAEGTGQAFSKLRNKEIDVYIISDSHLRKIDLKGLFKVLGLGQVPGSEKMRFELTDKLKFSTDVLYQNFQPILDVGHPKTRVNSKYFRGFSHEYSFRRQSAINTGVRLMTVGSEFVETINTVSRSQDLGRAYATWRFVPSLKSKKFTEIFIGFDFIIRGDIRDVVKKYFKSSSLNYDNAEVALQARLDNYLPPKFMQVWLDEDLNTVVDSEITNLLEKPYSSSSIQSYIDENVKMTLIDAVSRKYLSARYGSWSEFILQAEEVVSSNNFFLEEDHDRCSLAAQSFEKSEKQKLHKLKMREAGLASADLGFVDYNLDREEKIMWDLRAGLESPQIIMENVGAVFLSNRPLR